MQRYKSYWIKLGVFQIPFLNCLWRIQKNGSRLGGRLPCISWEGKSGVTLVEDVAELAEDAVLRFFGGLHIGSVGKSLNLGAFSSSVRFSRNVNHYVDEFVASVVALIFGETFAAQTEDLAGLSASGDFESCASAKSGHLNRASESCGGEVKHKIVDHIVAIADKLGVLDFINYNEKVAIDAAVYRGIAFALDGESHAASDTCRDVERKGLFLVLDASAVAVLTLVLNNLAFTIAFGTDCCALLHTENALLCAHNSASAVAGGAGGEGCAVFGSSAVAMGVGNKRFQLKGLVNAFGNVIKGHFDGDAKVVATTLACARTTSGATEAARVMHMAAENVAESSKNIFHRHAATKSSKSTEAAATSCAGKSLWTHAVSKLVVFGAFFGVGENIIGLGGLFEFLFGFFVARVFVRVIFDCHFAVGFFQLFRSG